MSNTNSLPDTQEVLGPCSSSFAESSAGKGSRVVQLAFKNLAAKLCSRL